MSSDTSDEEININCTPLELRAEAEMAINNLLPPKSNFPASVKTVLDLESVKSELLMEHVRVKDEPSCSNICVKDEPSSEEEGARGASAAAAAAARLYADHVVKDELVLGPELVEPPRVRATPAAPSSTEQALRRACSVRLERMRVDAERRSCRVGRRTYPLRRTRDPRDGTDTSSSKTYQCDECCKLFRYKSVLRKHIHTHLSGSSRDSTQKGFAQSTMSLETLCVNTEAEVCVKEEAGMSEDEAGARVASALCELYAGHQVKAELVLGPEEMHRPHVLPALPAAPLVCAAAGTRACAVRLERLPARALLTHTGQTPTLGRARLAYKNEPPKTNKRQARVQEKEENAKKRLLVEKHQEPFTSHEESPTNTDTLEVPPQPAFDTFSAKTDSNATHFKCDLCSKGFDIKSQLEKHIQTHELMKKSLKASKDFTCKKCSCTFKTKLLQVEHAKSRHAEVYFTCSECEYMTCNKGHIQTHLRTHTGERPSFKCTQCSSAFARSDNLQRHLRTHTGYKPYKCTQCSSAFGRSCHLQSHLRTHTGDKPYKCTQCSSAFAQSCHLQSHLKTHTGEKPFKCTQCSSAFAQSSNLQRHLRTHTGYKPYKCTQCSSAFAQSCHLQSHLRTHTGDKPYKCTQCSSAFAQSCHLQSHLRTHTGDKPYKRAQCSSAFTRSGHLQSHMNTGVKPYECNMCEYKATQSSTLKKHVMSRHSGQKPYGCDTCSYRGATRRYLSLHMKRQHKQA